MIVLAMGCHPDDIEFMMSGTLILLKQAGADIHYMNIANGCYGSAVYSKEEAARIRCAESQAAAQLIGATWHPSIADDVNVFYTPELLAQATAVVRKVQPDILLTLSRYDYMEDHEHAARLAASAAFNRCLGAYVTTPPYPAIMKPVAVYHALPHSLMDMMRQPVTPDFVVDVSSVMGKRIQMLEQHTSQKEWLDATQGIGSFVETLRKTARSVGEKWGPYCEAEGWRCHNYMGYCDASFKPLETLLANTIFHL
jgi:LmbE family N-acetylglucosaminyl deacetylase